MPAVKEFLQSFSPKERIWLWASAALLAAYLFLAGVLMGGLDFNDETEKFVAARLLGSGLLLYKDIFVQHGPVVYMLSHIMYLLTEAKSMAPYRIIPIIFSLCTLAALVASPALTTRRAQLMAATLFLFGLIVFQAQYTFVMTMYQVYAGYLFVIAMVLFILPFAMGCQVKKWHAFVAGFCLSWIFFNAFSFAIAIAFCFLVCGFGFLSQPDKRKAFVLLVYGALGGIFGTLIVALWMWRFGDFMGYYVDHIYINMTSYKKYMLSTDYSYMFRPLWFFTPGIWWFYFTGLRPHFALDITIAYTLPALAILALSIETYRQRLLGRHWIFYGLFFFIAGCAFMYMNPRFSNSFGGAPFILAALGAVSFACAVILQSNKISFRTARLPAISLTVLIGLLTLSGLLTVFAVKTNLYQLKTWKYYQARGSLGPLETEQMKFLHSIVGENEPVQQFPFHLIFYVHTDRLPASGQFFWMPWMNDYSKDPVEGYPLDLCKRMQENPPKAISYMDMDIWGNMPDTFMGCFKELLATRYFPSIKVEHVWIRADIAVQRDDIFQTSIISEDFDPSYLPANLRKKVQTARMKYAKLQHTVTGECVGALDVDNEKALKTVDCKSSEARSLGYQPEETKIVDLDTYQCLELKEKKKRPSSEWKARFWPCSVGDGQIFIKEKAGPESFVLRNKFTNLCLGVKDGYVVQDECGIETQWHWRRY